MKKLVAIFLALVMLLGLTACATTEKKEDPTTESPSTEPVENIELVVFAAASMTETLDKVIELYKAVAPNVTIIPTYDSSGTLKTQIQEGADCDLFISAAQKQMNQLDATKDAEANPDKLDFVDSATRVNIFENKVVLVVPEGNPANIKSFADLSTAKLIALGNSDVPVGSYSLEILKFLGLDVAQLEAQGKITYGSNVKEVTTHVTEKAADCGIVYATDAFSAGLTVVDTATTEMCKQVIYPAAVLKNSQNADAAKAFIDFLSTDEAMAIFTAVGFAKA